MSVTSGQHSVLICSSVDRDTFKSIIVCKFNVIAVHALKPNANDGAKIAIRGEVIRPKTCSVETSATQPGWRRSCASGALTPDRTNRLSAAQTSSRTVVQSPTFTCRNSLAVGYQGESLRSSSHRQSGMEDNSTHTG